MNCSLEAQPRGVGVKKSTQNLAPIWGKEISLGHDKESRTTHARSNVGMKDSKLGQAGAVQSFDGAQVTETCHNGTCHQTLHMSATAKAHGKTTKAPRKT